MKKLLLALCLVPILAQAEAFYAENNSGGRIVITDGDCNMNGKRYVELREAYAYGESGRYMAACWVFMDGAVHVVYRDGERRVYPVTSFRRLD